MDKLRTATPMGDWRSFKFINITGGTLTEGKLCLIQETAGVLFLDIRYDSAGCKVAKTITTYDADDDAEDYTGVLIYHAEKILVPKETGTGLSFLPGDNVYWDGVHANGVTPTYNAQGAKYWIGIAVQAASITDDEVLIDLLGNKTTIGAQT